MKALDLYLGKTQSYQSKDDTLKRQNTGNKRNNYNLFDVDNRHQGLSEQQQKERKKKNIRSKIK